MPDPHSDWHEVVDRHPCGLLVMHEDGWLVYGSVSRVMIEPDGSVRIDLCWATEKPIRSIHERRIPEEDLLCRRFPNFHTLFYMEDSPHGARIRFGKNLLYLDPMPSLETRQIEELCTEAALAS